MKFNSMPKGLRKAYKLFAFVASTYFWKINFKKFPNNFRKFLRKSGNFLEIFFFKNRLCL